MTADLDTLFVGMYGPGYDGHVIPPRAASAGATRAAVRRRRWLRIPATWPWADQITAAFTRIAAIPAPG